MPVESYSNKRTSIKTNNPQLITQFEEQSLAAQATPITYIVDYSYVNDIVQNYDVFSPHYSLIDVRSYPQHLRGRIPSSLWAHSTLDYLNPDGTMRAGVDILSMWDSLGIDYKRKHLIFYSNDEESHLEGDESSTSSAASAAEIMYYAELMGLYKISVYEGGWREWSRMANNAFQMGPSTDSESISFETLPSPSPPPFQPYDELLESLETTTSKLTTFINKITSTATTARSSTTGSSTKSSIATSTKKTSTLSLKQRNTTTITNSYFKEQFDRVTAVTPSSNGGISCVRFSFSFNMFSFYLILFKLVFI